MASGRPAEEDQQVLQPTRRRRSRASTFTLGVRRSLDLGAAVDASGGGPSNSKRHSRAETANGSGDRMGENGGSGSKWGTVSTANLAGLVGSGSRFATVASSSNGSNGNGSSKRTRPGFSLGGLFSPSGKGSSTVAVDAIGSTPAIDNASDVRTGTQAEREEALMEAVDAANDEHTAWEIVVTAVPVPDSLFLLTKSSSPAAAGSSVDDLSSSTSFTSNLAKLLSPNGKTGQKKRGMGSNIAKGAVSPASEPAGPLLALCVTTGNRSLTLYRSIARVASLDAEVRVISLRPNEQGDSDGQVDSCETS